MGLKLIYQCKGHFEEEIGEGLDQLQEESVDQTMTQNQQIVQGLNIFTYRLQGPSEGTGIVVNSVQTVFQ